LRRITQISKKTRAPATQICAAAGLAYSTFRRWMRRAAAGLPLVSKPGPRPVEPLDESKLFSDILALAHCEKRTHGTGGLYEKFRSSISRRDLYKRIRRVRRMVSRMRKGVIRRFRWNRPGAVMATDTVEVKLGGSVYHVQTIRDQASGYLDAHTSASVPTDSWMAKKLGATFATQGAPLLLKRDNAKNENGSAVNALLDEHWVLPLNSPEYYPRYNGGVEGSQSEIQDELAKYEVPMPCPEGHASAHVARAISNLNHKPRKNLRGKCACGVFHSGACFANMNKRKRVKLAAELKARAARLLAQKGGDTPRQARSAWRIVVEEWLLESSHITEKTKHVLPHFNVKRCS